MLGSKKAKEEERLNDLKASRILENPDKEMFNRITSISKTLFKADIASISFVDAEKVYFRSTQGLKLSDTQRTTSFSGHTILQDDIFIISDARLDKRFCDNSMVTNEPYIRFYAGAPITGPSGYNIGAICIFNSKPINFNAEQKKFLKDLASWVDIELSYYRMNSTFHELEKSRERLALAAQSAQIGVWDWEIESNALIWDDRMYALYGTKKENFSGAYEAWENGLHPEDRDRAASELKNAVANKRLFDTEFRVCWPDNSVHYIKAFGKVIRGQDGAAINVIGVNWDITLQKEQEARIKQLTISDDLTGLYNRRGFRVLAEKKIQESYRQKKNIAVLLIDIDKMKDINDKYGHIAGDDALVAAADLLKKSLRESDIICRWGGDEFVILVVEPVKANVKKVITRLEENVNQYNLAQNNSFQLQMSIGEFIKDSSMKMSLEDLIKAADAKMYQMKCKPDQA